MACLEDGLVSANDTIDTYAGEYKFYEATMRDSKPGGHGNVTIQRSFEVSSNIAFSRLVTKCYGGNKQRFLDRLHDLGLCDSLGIEIKGEGHTYMKSLSDPTWSGTTLPWMSIGYEIKITPLQLLTFYNAVANNGTMMRPMFVEAVVKDGKTLEEKKPHVMRNAIASRKTIRTVREMLKGVVENGTASNISNTSYKIAGKTGTAQVAHGGKGYTKDGTKRYLASFAGYFPADDPLYSCVVMVYGPSNRVYYGNVVAGTVVKDIADRVYAAEFRKGSGQTHPEVLTSGKMPYSKGGHKQELVTALTELRIPHSSNIPSADWLSSKAQEAQVSLSAQHFTKGQVPDVRGMGASDAVSLLESQGMKVKMSGMGHVSTQSPAPGTTYSNGTTIVIGLSN